MAANPDSVARFTATNDCTKCDLSGADLSGLMLHGRPVKRVTDSDFSNAVLSRADLQQADFNCTNLAGAKLDEVTARRPSFDKADLNGADLSNAVLDTPSFFMADLTDANFSGVTWGRTTQETALSSARLCNTTMPDGAVDNSGCDGPALDRNWCVNTWR